MFDIILYRSPSGREPVREALIKLSKRKDKESKASLAKINDYVKALGENGKALGEPYIKHLKGEIWELRPLKNRILFFGYDGNKIILLSYFVKTTRKTPKSEIEKAEKRMKDYLERL
ncbi:MAG: type II toxin-antitoxin system RelE/ParE family toxin [Firmicutes bacterium]|nr:type II toxin-antitoxin system RelE/ParE family toxin [Bacillota bacterium]